MNILLVTAVVAGGVGRHVRQLARGLARQGHAVVVACPTAVAEQFRLAEHGVHVETVEIGAGRLPLPGPRQTGRLAALVGRADVVHAHGVRAGAYAALARRRSSTPLVVTTHNAPPAGRAGVVYRVLEEVVCRRGDLVLGVSPDLVARARRRGAAAVGLAVVPADDTPVSGPEERRAARWAVRTELGLPTEGGPPVIVSAGRLGAQKRTGLVLEAYHRLLATVDRHPPPVLVLAGDGPERAELERLAGQGPGDVRLLGQRDDVPTLLAGADVAVSAAVWEGQPLFLQEALAAGTPVVATDVGGTGLVLGGAGLLVPGEGRVAEALAGAVRRVLQEPGLAEDLRTRSLARAAELPTVEEAVAAALEAYRCLRPGR
ncbi:glycosyltransferase family 4 protein [Ornithinimicrobium flavum]|uniref:glycosyltransferase family 4 protein n=1 Tax=Ornithinimicrobium flavum TaxID=1288636 RepID=UPI00106FCAD0|nr:glycosyltransferase family 4 protein [Ornithinimicrobium flavum]